jgi:transcriptional regulator with XRE-family HTH domain
MVWPSIGAPTVEPVRLPYMQGWAKRIKERLDAGRKDGLSATGLARACGISQPSVSQWFNDSGSKKATEMIRGDNLLSAARYLNVRPEWILTGKGPATASQPLGLDRDTLEVSVISVKEMLSRAGLELDAFLAAPMLMFAYDERLKNPGIDPKAFDDLIWTKLQGELGRAGHEQRAAKGSVRSNEEDETDAPKARRSSRGRPR